MLRNLQPCTFLLRHYGNQQRHFHQHLGVLYNKSSSTVLRQGKIMGKLFGNRVSGSKKRWFPHTDATNSAPPAGIVFKESQFGKTPNSGGKNASRRMTVLNKLFMKHVTDLMATGEISESILGKGLQVSRVKISQDFAYVNVFWLTTGEAMKDALMEHELQKCSGILRHELSQLGLMGVVPRIKFVKDKLLTNASHVELLLKSMDFGEEESNEDDLEEYTRHATDFIKRDFYNSKEMTTFTCNTNLEPEFTKENKSEDFKVPEMRHDVLGLDHKSIMLKIYTKMRKSKQAWEQHHQKLSDYTIESKEMHSSSVDINDSRTPQLEKTNDKSAQSAENSKKFEAFLAKRKDRKNTPDRKKYRDIDHRLELAITESQEHEVVLSNRQRQRYEAEDYLPEELEDTKL